MSKLIFFLFVLFNSSVSYSLDFDKRAELDFLSFEKAYLSRLELSTIEVLIPIKMKGKTYTLNSIQDLSLEEINRFVERVIENRWEPKVRKKIIYRQIENCKSKGFQDCVLYDNLFPNKAVSFTINSKKYVAYRKDIAEDKILEYQSDPVKEISELSAMDESLYGLYSIPDNDLLVSNLVYEEAVA